MRIKNANITYARAISKLSNQLGYIADEIAIKNRLEIILAHSENCVFVAVEDDKIIGWIHGFYTMRIESDFFVEIGGLVVDENYRRKGVGKLLIENVILWAKTKNCNKIRVRCNSKRVESHIFYENIGFSLNKEQKIFDKNID